MKKCEKCEVWTYNEDHICVEYNGPACRKCGKSTVFYVVGAPGYGSGRICPDGHDEPLSPRGELTLADVY